MRQDSVWIFSKNYVSASSVEKISGCNVDTNSMHHARAGRSTIWREATMQIRKIKTSANQTSDVRLLAFFNELEDSSNRYGIALRVAGGIICFDPAAERVAYVADFISGDLEPKIGRK
jgi:hypothetical protein